MTAKWKLKLGDKITVRFTRGLRHVILLYFVAVTAAGRLNPAQSTTVEGTTQTIKVRLVNGKTGNPIKNDTPNIWFGDATHPINPATNSDGEAVVNVNVAQFQELRIMPNLYADCRVKEDRNTGMRVKYSLEEIITRGVVSENLCGKPRTAPIPKVLVLYVRPRTFMEKWRL
jgi:hypothetical protein